MSMTSAERANQRNAVLAGFLGWTLDAFDFFVLTFVLDDVARSFGKARPDIALALTLALTTRPIGAVIFGLMADRWGRRLPLMINVVMYAVLSIFIRSKVKEPEAWHEHRTDWTTYRKSIFQYWPRFLFLVLFMTMLSFMSHGTQDMYPTLLKSIGFTPKRIADMTVLSGVGAVLGGLLFGHYSDRSGRRRAMIIATVCCLLVVPFWVNGHSMIT